MKKNKSIIESAVTTVFLGLMIYAAYSLWYIFYGKESGSDIHLYTVLAGSALGWFLLLFTQTIFKNAGWIKKLVAFLAGNALFQGLIWGINAKINPDCMNNDDVVINTFTVTFVLSAILLLITYILRVKNKHKILNIILAIVYFVISCGGLCVINEENIKALSYKKDIHFDTMNADEMNITDSEKTLCEEWFEDNFFAENCEYPFTFKVDGEEFNPADWEKSFEYTPDIYSGNVYKGGKTEYLVLSNESKGLSVTVELTHFADNATCQWTVYIKNTGTTDSEIISDFYALDSSFATGKADLYYSMGSDTAASDFSLIKKDLSFIEKKFSGADGKPTETYLPYFNISGENHGMILGIGWTGQWAAGLSESNGATDISVKQEHFEAYLLAGEEVRSPLVSISFYENTNPLKGFNLFRKWIMDSVYPENVTQNSYTVMEIAGPMSTKTSDEIIEILDGIDDSVYAQTDAFWMDAGWYKYNSGWHDGVGNWTVDTSRYDNGISELSGYAAKKGLGHVLWYEPERVYPGTEFHNIGSQHEEWLIYGDSDNIMWNLANEDAFKFYCEYLLNSMKENGITVYRQDFNFAPMEYWQRADNEFYGGRTGICENHYITNLYRYLDYLCENIEGLIIDNCASGGKRLDLEMTYRSIAFWRSDYNCSLHTDFFEATQSHTYGISFWLPITGANLYMLDEYSARSAIMPLMLMDFYSNTHADFSFHKEQREMMAGNYYPLDFGSFDKDKMHAMQYSSYDALSGTALIYKRADVKDSEYTVKLNGLVPSAAYSVYDTDYPETVYNLTGEELMNSGITLNLPEGEKAIILMYNAQ
ncbi:MAG: alpha-galactosidase [Ruminococcaceae bacterium]|nr:alpha-galactosidase [Oscillospiraceae bacterium]